jgi:hypothetical protein
VRSLLAVLLAGGLLSLALYGLLSAVDHSAPVEPEDPWLEAFRAGGLVAQLVSVSSDPDKHLAFADARDLAKGRSFDHSVLRRYTVQNVTVQVAILPRGDLLPELPEGRHPGFRLKPKGSVSHLCRSGRNLLFVRTTQSGLLPMFDDPPTPRPLAEKLFEIFEKTAARFP